MQNTFILKKGLKLPIHLVFARFETTDISDYDRLSKSTNRFINFANYQLSVIQQLKKNENLDSILSKAFCIGEKINLNISAVFEVISNRS